jgi:cyanophycinase
MLVLVGSGEYLPEMDPVDRVLLAELGQRPSVVCLPTAAGTEGPDRIRYWSELGVNHFNHLGAVAQALPVITRQDAGNKDLAEQVRQAEFVYLSGGRPDYLFNVLQESLVWQAIRDVLEQGGILAGCSAGAMVMGAKVPGFPRAKPAFNLLPDNFMIVPHFDEIPTLFFRLMRLLTSSRFRMVGIPGSTALVVRDSQAKVLGKGSVELWSRKGRRRWMPGEVVDW